MVNYILVIQGISTFFGLVGRRIAEHKTMCSPDWSAIDTRTLLAHRN